jgi:glutathione S-transferase
MKLYYAPGACSLSPHIALREAGLPFEAVKVDLKSKAIAASSGGGDFRAIHPNGYVPALQLDDGTLLTEGPAIVQYLADQVPAAGLAPPNGTLARYRLQSWLNFITSELHKQFSPLFDASHPEDMKARQRYKLATRFDWVAQQLEGHDYLTGNTFTVADAYLFTVLNWCAWTGIDLARWPVLAAFQQRVAARPKVREALAAEGLAR